MEIYSVSIFHQNKQHNGEHSFIDFSDQCSLIICFGQTWRYWTKGYIHPWIPIPKLVLPICTPTSSVEECSLPSLIIFSHPYWFFIFLVNQLCPSFKHLGGDSLQIINFWFSYVIIFLRVIIDIDWQRGFCVF